MAGFDPWGPISSLLFELSSDDVQRIVERAGLTPDWTLSKEEAYSHTTRKRAFRGRIAKLYQDLHLDERKLFIINVARGIIDINPDHRDRINDLLQNIGWALAVDRLIQVDVLDPSDLVNLPQSARDDLSKAAERLPSDLSGAITNACGAVESVCAEIYGKFNLGEVEKASFQEKVNRSLDAVKALERLKEELVHLGWEEDKAEILCKNLKGAVSQAAYVMQGIRSGMGDVHGSKPALNTIAFDSIKWAMIISSLMRE
jgi:hypothetical protein